MSAALVRGATTPVPTGRGRSSLRVVPPSPVLDAGRPAPRGVAARAPRRAGRPGRERGGLLLLVPLGEVLVPAGRTPVLRLVPADTAAAGGRGGGAAHGGAAGRPGRGAGGVPVAHGPRARLSAPRARQTSPPLPGAATRPGTPRRGPAATGPSRPLRRAAVAALALALLLGGARVLAGGGGVPAAAAAAPGPEQRVVVVQQGQTLWSLAREIAPEADPRVLVEELRLANRLEGAGLAIGQRLLVPAAP